MQEESYTCIPDTCYLSRLHHNECNKTTYAPIILEDMDVFAALMMHSLPSSSTFTVRCSWMYLQASLREKHESTDVTHLKQLRPPYSLARQPVPRNDRCRMYLQLDQIFSMAEQLCSQNHLQSPHLIYTYLCICRGRLTAIQSV